MYPVFLKDKGKQKYEKYLLNIFSKYPGGACWPLDDDLATVSRTGVVRELSGLYPGVPSGVTYYNQVTVTGTLSPDATGTYTVAGVYNELPYYRRGSDDFFIWFQPAANGWRLTTVLGSQSAGVFRWNAAGLVGTYSAVSPATGTATVASVPASGIYRFDPSGVTFAQPGPVLGGDLKAAAGFDGAAGRIKMSTTALINTTQPFTLLCWFDATSFSGLFINICANSGNRVVLGGGGSNKIGFGTLLAGWNASGIRQTTAASAGWKFVCATRETTDASRRLYVDGILVDTESGSPSLDNSPGTHLGANETARYYNGSLAYAAIIPAALTSDDILALYQNSIK